MAGYRLYFLDAHGHVERAQVMDCADDAHAIIELEKLPQGQAVELWDRTKLIARKGSPGPTAAPRTPTTTLVIFADWRDLLEKEVRQLEAAGELTDELVHRMEEVKAILEARQRDYNETLDAERRFEIRAEEYRTLADCTSDARAKESYRQVAEGYERLARNFRDAPEPDQP
jgi:hypothetical protein